MKNRLSPKSNLIESPTVFQLLLVACFGILAMLPVYFWGFPTGAAGGDFDNHFRFVLPFYDEIGNGNIIPAWLAESNNGFGDARFRFYPPFLYYALCLFRYLTGDWYFAALIVFTLFSVIGALGVYFWSRRSLSNRTAVLAALLFAFVPYHLTQFYQASLLAEFAATSLLPFAFMFVERIMTGENNQTKNPCRLLFNIAGLAVFFALIVTTHLPTTVIGSLSLGIFALLLTDWKNDKKALFYCALGIAVGLILSSWFWVKMLGELGWIQAGEKVNSPYYDYRNNFVFSPFSPSNLNTWYGSLLAALTVGIFLPSLIILRRIFRSYLKRPDFAHETRETDKKKKYFGFIFRVIRVFRGQKIVFKQPLGKIPTNESGEIANSIEKFFVEKADKIKIKKRLSAAVLVALFSFLMTTDLSRPLWAIIPKLKDVQFPYRWLTVTSIMICPVVALALQIWRERIKQKNFRAIHLPLLLGFAVALFFTIQDLVIDTKYVSRGNFLQRIEESRGARSFTDWLPRGANELKDLQPLNGQVDAGERKVTVSEWQSRRRIFFVEAGAENQARLRSYYYPLWKAFVRKDGQTTPTATTQAADGTLLVTIPPDAVEVEVIFVEPPRTKISLIIAMLGWTITLALLIICFIKIK